MTDFSLTEEQQALRELAHDSPKRRSARSPGSMTARSRRESRRPILPLASCESNPKGATVTCFGSATRTSALCSRGEQN
jgi:hypothetical protein